MPDVGGSIPGTIDQASAGGDVVPEVPAPAGTEVPGPRAQSDRRRGGKVILAVLASAVLVIGVVDYALFRHRDQANQLSDVRISGLPPRVPTQLANLMGLSPVPSRTSPNFSLVDQSGHTLSLTDFRGRAVVLEFMDPHCTDICPIVSQEFIDAYRELGRSASGVAFLGVNVNEYYDRVTDVAQFSREHQLTTIASWHFLTGSASALRTVWSDYNVQVEAPNPNADIVHTSIIYFIDPQGNERYIASPMVDHTPSGTAYVPQDLLASWGHGIALVSTYLSR
jgi:protein SCO1/2